MDSKFGITYSLFTPRCSILVMEVNENTRISDLTNAQLHELNQTLLDAATDVNRPLVDKMAPLSNLREEYVNPSFLQQIDWLKERGYESLRRTRGE